MYTCYILYSFTFYTFYVWIVFYKSCISYILFIYIIFILIYIVYITYVVYIINVVCTVFMCKYVYMYQIYFYTNYISSCVLKIHVLIIPGNSVCDLLDQWIVYSKTRFRVFEGLVAVVIFQGFYKESSTEPLSKNFLLVGSQVSKFGHALVHVQVMRNMWIPPKPTVQVIIQGSMCSSHNTPSMA